MDLDDLVRRAAAALRTAAERALAPLDLTPAQFAVLRIVVDRPGISSAEAARVERLTPPTLSVIVANLERKGALSRRPHPDNGRIQCLEPTDMGRELAARGLGQVRSLQGRMSEMTRKDAEPAIRAWLLSVAEIGV